MQNGPEKAAASTQPAASSKPLSLRAVLPHDEGPYYPSLARTVGQGEVNTKLLAETRSCGDCHADAEAEWRSSAHAHASFDNPWYRASVDQLRQDIGNTASRHCAGCHDPLLLFAGQMEREIAPENELATGGVTCLVCHGVVEARTEGNASYVLRTDPVPIPQPGDPESIARHRERLAPKALHGPALCATCHRGFLGRYTGIGHHLSGMDEPGAWRGSPWAGSQGQLIENVKQKDCADCHMRWQPVKLGDRAAKDGRERSHRFAGGHSALSELLGDGAQSDAISEQLKSALRVDVPVVYKNGQAQLAGDALDAKPGDLLALDLVLFNQGAGHNFPGGVKDMQDTWVELSIKDARGRELASAGKQQAKREDPSAFVLRALVVDAEGVPETRHIVTHFGSVAYDHTVPPLGSRVVRYSLRLPQGFALPLSVEARVLHRRHRAEARQLACEVSKSERGRRFAQAERARGAAVLDGCYVEPIDEVSHYETTLGKPEAQQTPLSERLYEHALGLSADLQERLDGARFSIARALRLLDTDAATARERGRLLALLARVAGRQGRLQEALDSAKQAEELLGQHPAIDRARAIAYAQVWKWADAKRALEQVTEGAPGDTSAWRDLAQASVAARDPLSALRAAKRGFQLQPRDEGLLRSQTLALEALKSPDAPKARKAFLFYREADETSASRLACDKRLPTCSRDRLPVVTIELAPEPAAAH